MLDEDLAELYGVPTKRLNQQVTRNINRFPEDFMFRLTREEDQALRSQNVTLKGRGQHRKYHPRAFTEHNILMLWPERSLPWSESTTRGRVVLGGLPGRRRPR